MTTTETRRRIEPAELLNLIAMPFAAATLILLAIDTDTDFRIFSTAVLFSIGPGSALTRFVRIPDPYLQIGLSFGLSVAVDLLVSQFLIAISDINGILGACILTAITFSVPLVQLFTRGRRPV